MPTFLKTLHHSFENYLQPEMTCTARQFQSAFPILPHEEWCAQSVFGIITQKEDKWFSFWAEEGSSLSPPQLVSMHLNDSLMDWLTVNSGGQRQPGRCPSHLAGYPEGSGWPAASPLAPSNHLSPEREHGQRRRIRLWPQKVVFGFDPNFQVQGGFYIHISTSSF